MERTVEGSLLSKGAKMILECQKITEYGNRFGFNSIALRGFNLIEHVETGFRSVYMAFFRILRSIGKAQHIQLTQNHTNARALLESFEKTKNEVSSRLISLYPWLKMSNQSMKPQVSPRNATNLGLWEHCLHSSSAFERMKDRNLDHVMPEKDTRQVPSLCDMHVRSISKKYLHELNNITCGCWWTIFP